MLPWGVLILMMMMAACCYHCSVPGVRIMTLLAVDSDRLLVDESVHRHHLVLTLSTASCICRLTFITYDINVVDVVVEAELS